MEESDAQLHLKKRARRRLVGALAFVLLAAVALPMVMDSEPRPVPQDIDIRIPGQDEQPFVPKFASAPPPRQALEPVAPEAPPSAQPARPAKPEPPQAESARPAPENVPAASPPLKPPEKAVEKAPAKPEKPAEKAAKPADGKDSAADSRRAAAILAGKTAEPAAKGGEHVILIGAFANEANVKTIRGKLGELGIRIYTEPLDSPQGKKTRVRAGPFPSRDAADKALDKMKRIGVSGVVAARQ